MRQLSKVLIGLVLGLAFVLTACEDIVEIDTADAPAFIVVDAWISDAPTTQSIRLSLSQAYFENSFTSGVAGATVEVSSNTGQTIMFSETQNGQYTWTPDPGQVLGSVGEIFTLTVDIEGRRLQATSVMLPAPPIDSIVQEFRENEITGPDGIYAQFFARDLPGIGNTYWIKTFKNGLFLNKPEEINIAFDAGFDAGAQLDQLIFIPPIRELVNPIPDSLDNDVAPYEVGDQIRVEIHSIGLPAFEFLSSARDEILNGSNGIFAAPIANSPGNVVDVSTGEPVLGVFNVAQVQSLEIEIE